jgi:hypothetical protein
MAVGIRLKLAGGKQEQYDAVSEIVNVNADPPQGMIFHCAGPIDDGWGVIDVWESRDAFDSFVAARLMPAIEAAGDGSFPGPPDIKEFPVHNYVKA